MKLTPFIALVISMCFTVICAIAITFHVKLAYEPLPTIEKVNLDDHRDLAEVTNVYLSDGNIIPIRFSAKLITNEAGFDLIRSKFKQKIFIFFYNYSTEQIFPDSTKTPDQKILNRLLGEMRNEIPEGIEWVDITIATK